MAEMTAVAFLKEWKRMCDDCLDCDDCPMYEIRRNNVDDCMNIVRKNPEEAVGIVQHWTEEHPAKTMLQDFMEKYPKATLNYKGIPEFCPHRLGYETEEAAKMCQVEGRWCVDCWNRPLEVTNK